RERRINASLFRGVDDSCFDVRRHAELSSSYRRSQPLLPPSGRRCGCDERRLRISLEREILQDLAGAVVVREASFKLHNALLAADNLVLDHLREIVLRAFLGREPLGKAREPGDLRLGLPDSVDETGAALSERG